jgi:hypothetical protein
MASSIPTPISSRSAATSGASIHPVLEMPAGLVAQLPCPVLLRISVPGSPAPVSIWTGQLPHQVLAARRVLAETIVFDAQELAALVCATEADRLWHADLLGLCFEKWRLPSFSVQAAKALAGANPDPGVAWTLQRVFQRLGIQLDAVEFDCSSLMRSLDAAA